MRLFHAVFVSCLLVWAYTVNFLLTAERNRDAALRFSCMGSK